MLHPMPNFSISSVSDNGIQWLSKQCYNKASLIFGSEIEFLKAAYVNMEHEDTIYIQDYVLWKESRPFASY